VSEELERLAERLQAVDLCLRWMGGEALREGEFAMFPTTVKIALEACAAEIERLQCCGNCHHLMQHMRLCRLEKENADGTVSTRECCAPCQFTPSCWDQP